MMQVRNKIKSEIADDQCGFVEKTGTTNAIYTLQTIIKQSLEVQKGLYLSLIDYTKAFDRAQHKEIMIHHS